MGAVHVEGCEVGAGTAALIFVFDAHCAAGAGSAEAWVRRRAWMLVLLERLHLRAGAPRIGVALRPLDRARPLGGS